MDLAGLVAVHLAVLAALAVTAWAGGRLVLRWCGVSADGDAGAGVALAMAAGCMLIAQAAFALGLAGMLRLPWVVAAGVAVHAAAWRDWRELASRVDRRTIVAAALAALAAAPVVVLSLYPPLGFDQTMYHLPTARAFAETGGLPFVAALRFPVFPALAEVMNAVVLLAASAEATQVTGVLAYAACVSLAWAWARRESTPAGAWLAAAVLAGSPIGWYLASTGYVEPLLALFGLASLAAADRSREESGVAWLILAGLLAGSAAGVKYLGLYFVPAAAALALPSEQRLIDWRRLAIYGAAAAAALAPTYLRLVAHTGNPVFPFYPQIFGDSPWLVPEFLGRRGLERAGAALTLVWDMTFRRERLGWLPPYSPAFVLGVPVALVAAWRFPSLRRLAALTAGYVALAPVHAHYPLAIAPLWAVVVGAGAGRLAERSRAATRGLVALAVCVAAIGHLYAIHRIGRLGWPPVTDAGRSAVVTAVRPVYPAIAFLNRTAPGATVYGVGTEEMVDYLRGPLLGDANGPVSHTTVAARARADGALAPALDGVGASWLLLRADTAGWIARAEADPRLSLAYRDAAARVYRVSAPAADPAPAGTGAQPSAPDGAAAR
jgi:hypothetical protein